MEVNERMRPSLSELTYFVSRLGRKSCKTVKAAFHDTDTDVLARILASKLRVSDERM